MSSSELLRSGEEEEGEEEEEEEDGHYVIEISFDEVDDDYSCSLKTKTMTNKRR